MSWNSLSAWSNLPPCSGGSVDWCGGSGAMVVWTPARRRCHLARCVTKLGHTAAPQWHLQRTLDFGEAPRVWRGLPSFAPSIGTLPSLPLGRHLQRSVELGEARHSDQVEQHDACSHTRPAVYKSAHELSLAACLAQVRAGPPRCQPVRSPHPPHPPPLAIQPASFLLAPTKKGSLPALE